MNKITVIKPMCGDFLKTERLSDVLYKGLKGYYIEMIETADDLAEAKLTGKHIIFAISLGESGINLEFYRMLKYIRTHRNMFNGSVAGIIIDGNSALFTKSVSRELVFSANRSGCAFVGRPLVEGTGNLLNFDVVAKNLNTDNIGAYRESCIDLVRRVVEYKNTPVEKPKILAIHASNSKTSNSLMLWHKVKEKLPGCEVQEISLRNGEVWDCRGCPYETCLHFGEENQCFYGGVITEQVYPAILECDALVMICPNYNDAVSANLTAFVNRMTALFRVRRFYDKKLYAVIVSGYSGSDIIAQQLISALNMNKSFMLPSQFAIMETANDPESVNRIDGIDKTVSEFAKRIISGWK